MREKRQRPTSSGPTTDGVATAAAVLGRLEHDGLLLFSDPIAVSVVGLVAGGPVHRSWWAHPAGGQIYRVGEILEGHADILTIPLILRKATLVHRQLWPEVLAMGQSREPWQLDGLPVAGRNLLRRVERAGEVRLDRVPPSLLPRKRSIGDVALDLERRLLVQGSSFHSETGKHVKQLVSWKRWAESHGVRGPLPAPSIARSHLESRVRELFPGSSFRRLLPWIR